MSCRADFESARQRPFALPCTRDTSALNLLLWVSAREVLCPVRNSVRFMFVVMCFLDKAKAGIAAFAWHTMTVERQQWFQSVPVSKVET